MLSLETPAHKQTHCMITRDTRINTIDCPNAHLMAIKIISLVGRTHRWKLRATTSPSSSEPVREKGRRQKRGQVRWQRTGRQFSQAISIGCAVHQGHLPCYCCPEFVHLLEQSLRRHPTTDSAETQRNCGRWNISCSLNVATFSSGKCPVTARDGRRLSSRKIRPNADF